MKKIIALNWKMNPASLKDAKGIVKTIANFSKNKNLDFILTPPFIYLGEISKLIKNKNIKLGAQDVSANEKTGSFTGDISATMLKNIGAEYSIIGHSERRYLLNEENSLISKKITSSQKSGVIPILCVGEKSKMSFPRAKRFITRQLFANINFKSNKKIIISYEPVWAIGGNKKINPERAAKMIGEIKEILKRRYKKSVKVLYGGSVNCKNIEELSKHNIIDGYLIGSASVNNKEISCIIKKLIKGQK